MASEDSVALEGYSTKIRGIGDLYPILIRADKLVVLVLHIKNHSTNTELFLENYEIETPSSF